ncbi:hypothetical protein ACFQU7_27020 [Pseudoroseomonas wenyumeiae]
MLGYALRRLAGAVPVLVAVSIFVFAFVRLLPGDPARLVAGPDATAQDVALVREEMGLDRPIWEQYLRYVGQTLQGDLGRSTKTKLPVAEEIGQRFMPTFWLTVVAMVWATVIGVLIGVISGVKRGKWQDRLGMVFAVSGISFLLLDGAAADQHLLGAAGLAANRRLHRLEEPDPALLHPGHHGGRHPGALLPLRLR